MVRSGDGEKILLESRPICFGILSAGADRYLTGLAETVIIIRMWSAVARPRVKRILWNVRELAYCFMLNNNSSLKL